MNDLAAPDAYGVITEPATLTIQRMLPGPIERVWSYLTDSELRAKWLASGTMETKAGGSVEFVWRNGELTDPPGQKPDSFGDEHRMQSTITECDPPHRLSFTWQGSGDVTFQLEPHGSRVLLTVIHRRLRDRGMMAMVGPGWHAHLDILVARVSGEKDPAPFWDHWSRLKTEYEKRLPA
jgi:uncharacterized protein YndB with AHSA1/START domain